MRRLILAGTLLIAGCASGPQTFHPPPVQASFLPVTATHPDYVAQDLRYEPFEALRIKVEKEIGHKLKNRGEAHITVITPPEWKTLGSGITMADVDQLAKDQQLAQTPFEPFCVGKGEVSGKQTYFVVVRSPGLVKFRQEVARMAQKKSKAPLTFEPTHFLPHVTLGFSDRDLHEQDGVLKNEDSCWRRWGTD